MLSRFRASVDYYNITIKNAIGAIGASNSLADCFNGKPGAPATNPTMTNANVFCQLIGRDLATGQLLYIIDTNANLGTYNTDGVDFQIDWGFDLESLGADPKWGSITTNIIGSRLITFDKQPVPGGITEHHVGTVSNVIGSNYPRWKFLWSLAWSVGPVEVGGRWRYTGSVADFNAGGLAAPAVSYFDLNGRWKINSMFDLRIGVNNIADKQPPILGTPIQANTDPSTYDVLGRRWYLGLRAKF
jgi:iron complex outermembrane receptor protein